MIDLNDQALLSRWYRYRNAEAFRVIASRHGRMVYATALRILRDPQDAEDATQQSFVALAQTNRPPTKNAAAWLHRTAYRTALNILRSRKRRIARDSEYATAKSDSASATWGDIREHVDEAVAALPDRYREAIVLYFFEEKTHAAIADSAGVSRQAVTYRIGKGVDLVRKKLAQKGVIAPAGAALVELIHQNATAAVPNITATNLGAVALAAAPSWSAKFLSAAGGLPLKGLVALVAVGFVTWAAFQVANPAPSNMQETAAAQTAADVGAQPSTRGATERELVGAQEASGVTDAADTAVARRDNTASTPEPADEPSEVAETNASVSGVVTLPDGRPFARAQVRLINVAYVEAGRYPDGTFFELAADTDGRFEQLDMAPAEYTVLVTEPEANGYNFAYNKLARVTLEPGDAVTDLKLVFGTEGKLTVSGTVVDSAGRPLEDVDVYKFGPVPRNDNTDTFGRFTLRYLPDDRVTVHTNKRGYRGPGVTTHAGDQDVRLVMYGDGAIQGRVVDADTYAPITKFEASFINDHRTVFQESYFWYKPEFESPDGTFEFPQVYADDVTVFARAPGYAPAMTHVTVEEFQTVRGVELRLSRAKAVTLTGKVVASDGNPIVGANVYMDEIPFRNARDRNISAVTDAFGTFEIEDASPELTFLTAWHPDYAPASGQITDTTTIVLEKPGRLNVEVFSQGQPMEKIQVYASYLAELRMSYIDGGVTDENGRALVEEVIPGNVFLQVQVSSIRSSVKLLELMPGEEKDIRFDIPPPAAEVAGYVRSNGKPLTQGSVELFVNTDLGLQRFTENISQDGSFLIRDVPVGNAQLMATARPKFRRAFVDDVPLDSRQRTTLSIDVTADRRISGTISGVRGGDFASVTVLRGVMGADEAMRAAIASDLLRPEMAGIGGVSGDDETGAYETNPLEPGTYTLVLRTYPANDYRNPTYHEVRVVEVPDNEDLVADFALNY